MHVIFFEIRPIEELQGSSSSPRREEVGRRTLGAIGGFLLSFFYRDRFQLFAQHFLVFIKNYHSEASRHLKSRRIELSPKSSTRLMK